MSNFENPPMYNNQGTLRREEVQRRFITRVYGWMTFGLLVTATAAMLTINTPGLVDALESRPLVYIGLLVVEIVMVFALSLTANRVSPLVAGLIFIGYAVLNGITLSIPIMIYTEASVAFTFAVTACTFGIMTVFGFTTHRDLTQLGSLLIMGLVGVILASILNLFFRNPAAYWIITYIGILIFIGLVAYDTQKLKNMSLGQDEHGRLTQNSAIIGALVLYLDFINLFLLLLRVLGREE